MSKYATQTSTSQPSTLLVCMSRNLKYYLLVFSILFPAAKAQESPDETLISTQLMETISSWAGAWQAQLPDMYFSFYVEDYAGAGYSSREAWMEERRQRILAPEEIRLRLIDFELLSHTERQASTRFKLIYERPDYQDETYKELVLEKMDGKWLISGETSLRVTRL